MLDHYKEPLAPEKRANPESLCQEIFRSTEGSRTQ